MRCLTVLGAALLAVLLSVATPAAELVVRGGRILAASGSRFQRNSGLVAVAGRIMEVQADLSDRDLGGALVVDLDDDDHILPGLIDLHAHYNMTLNEKRRDETEIMPLIYLANGATSTFTAGEFDPEALMAARRRIDAGEQVGPRIFNTGPYFGPARPGWNDDATPEEVAREVHAWAARGVAGIKVKRISARHLRAVIAAAHAHGLTVTGHLDSGYGDTVNPRDAILMGIDRVEHFLGGDALDADKPAYDTLWNAKPGSPEFRRISDLFIRHGVYFDATLTAFGYFAERGEEYELWTDERRFLTPHARELTAGRRASIPRFGPIYKTKYRTLKSFYSAGGGHLITLGTDHASTGEYLPGFSVHREMHAMVKAGIPAAAVLRIATINGARALGLGDRLGTLEPGKWADLIVVRGNPLRDIRRTRTVHTVIKGGEVHRSADLLALAEGRLGPAGPADDGDW